MLLAKLLYKLVKIVYLLPFLMRSIHDQYYLQPYKYVESEKYKNRGHEFSRPKDGIDCE